MGLSGYIHIALEKAKYKLLEDGAYYGEIPGLKGVWAEGKSLEACRKELQEVLDDWIVLKLKDGDPLPKKSPPPSRDQPERLEQSSLRTGLRMPARFGSQPPCKN